MFYFNILWLCINCMLFAINRNTITDIITKQQPQSIITPFETQSPHISTQRISDGYEMCYDQIVSSFDNGVHVALYFLAQAFTQKLFHEKSFIILIPLFTIKTVTSSTCSLWIYTATNYGGTEYGPFDVGDAWWAGPSGSQIPDNSVHSARLYSDGSYTCQTTFYSGGYPCGSPSWSLTANANSWGQNPTSPDASISCLYTFRPDTSCSLFIYTASNYAPTQYGPFDIGDAWWAGPAGSNFPDNSVYSAKLFSNGQYSCKSVFYGGGYPCSSPSWTLTATSHNSPVAMSSAPVSSISCIQIALPTVSPTLAPTNNPTQIPTNTPSKTPSDNPSNNPSVTPTSSPSNNPSNMPSITPSNTPTKNPSISPSDIT
eukprot:352973_1